MIHPSTIQRPKEVLAAVAAANGLIMQAGYEPAGEQFSAQVYHAGAAEAPNNTATAYSLSTWNRTWRRPVEDAGRMENSTQALFLIVRYRMTGFRANLPHTIRIHIALTACVSSAGHELN